MESAYIAKQAILDNKLNTVGYELLFRDSEINQFPGIDSDKATAQLIIQNYLIGDIERLCLNKSAFINFHENSLLNRYPSFFDKKSIVIEIDATIELSTQLLETIKYYEKNGYVIAIDGYQFDEKWTEYLPHVSIVKIEFDQVYLDEFAQHLAQLTSQKLKCLITKVETELQFDQLGKFEIDYFQGYFFNKPQMHTKSSLSPVKMTLLNLISEAFNPKLNFNNIAKIISVDVNLSVGLLKLVNGVAQGTEVKITSIKQASTYLGTEKLKQFISVFAISSLGTFRPNELIIQSLVRAKVMGAISELVCNKKQIQQAFMTGVLSSLDVILCEPFEVILKTLPLTEEIKSALLNNQGNLGELLLLIQQYEKGDMLHVQSYLSSHCSLSLDQINKAYGEAHYWSYQLLSLDESAVSPVFND